MQAGLLGDSIDVSHRFDTITSVYGASGVLVPAPTASIRLALDTYTATLSDTQIVLDRFAYTGGWTAATFNGPRFENLTEAFGSVTVNAASNMAGFSAANITLSGNVLALNWVGLPFDIATRVVLDVASPVAAVPEPRMLGLLLLALGAMALVRARRMA